MTTKFPIRPLRDCFFFKFRERIARSETGQRMFESKSFNSPIIVLGSQDDSIKSSRWVEVIATGPDVCEDIKVGSFVCLEPLKWSSELTNAGESFWKSEEQHVLAFSHDLE